MRHENGRSRLVRIAGDPERMTDAENRAYWGLAAVEILPENATDKEKWSFLWRKQVTPASALPKEQAQEEGAEAANARNNSNAKRKEGH